jgi:single-strand DNA-binding protein
MVSFNRVVLAGNLTRDPELRFTQNGVTVCNFPIAVDRIGSKKSSEAVDFFNVSCWRELGERVANYKKKGDPILVEGRLKYRTWQAPDGAKRSAVDVVADRVQFLSRAQKPQAEKNPQAPEVAAGASAKVGARRTAAAAARGAGGWGLLAAKQLHDDDGADDTDFEKEGFEEIRFE